ncbi:hypothetical protein ACJEHN_00580 [Legionella pneumophila]|uniref:hypothetical protein n=1 Tax=Legionella pneumophila TaxID=446 RepID=UPI0038B5070F
MVVELDETPVRTLLARQGIYDKNSAIVAYELLYRNSDAENSHVDNLNQSSGEAATSSVLVQLFANLDVNTIIGNKQAFINFTHSHLVQKIPMLLPKNRIVIEVLETVAIDQPLLLNLMELKKQGYQIALDDLSSGMNWLLWLIWPTLLKSMCFILTSSKSQNNYYR